MLTLLKVGAGIQIPANSSRLLLQWGLEPYLAHKVVEPEGMSFRRWENGKVIGYTKLVPDFRQNFNAPYYVIHRAHFHDALHKLALELGVSVRVASKAIEYNTEAPSVRTSDGTWYEADLIVAADGIGPSSSILRWRAHILNRHQVTSQTACLRRCRCAS